MSGCYVSQLSITVTKYLRQLIYKGRKGLFWLMVLEVELQNQVMPLLQASGKGSS
jgi:hypothetical protein